MVVTLLFMLCVAIALGDPELEGDTTKDETDDGNFDGKIVGGVLTTIDGYKYQLSLEYKKKLACGAVLIADKWALTAAHCTDSLPIVDLSIRAGSSNYETGGQVVKVKQVYQNKGYTPWVIDYDIAVLELEKPVNHPNAKPVALADANTAIKEGQSGIVTGWGLTRENGILSRGLRKVELPIVSQARCKASYGENSITERMFCAGFSTGGRDACQGDSGGPFVVKDKLVGIVSWGIGCARAKYPGVYTSVPAFRDFIKSVSGV